MTSVAVIGAGFAGLVVARRLQSLADVSVFEKSRGPGGRMATRYAGDFEFDHGAQFFTARSESFRKFLRPLIDAGIVACWHGEFAEFDRNECLSLRSWDDEFPHYVGTPRMNSIGKALSSDLNISFEREISSISRDADGWTLHDDSGDKVGPCDWLVLTAPAQQTALLAEAFPRLTEFCDERYMLGCFALMLGFREPVALPWQAALVRNADISWMSVNSSKPARNTPFSMLVHSTNAWAEAHIDDSIDSVLGHMLDEASFVSGMDLAAAVHRDVQRWRYANTHRQSGPAFFMDVDNALAACGDWCVRGRIEAAFLSADKLAQSLITKL